MSVSKVIGGLRHQACYLSVSGHPAMLISKYTKSGQPLFLRCQKATPANKSCKKLLINIITLHLAHETWWSVQTKSYIIKPPECNFPFQSPNYSNRSLEFFVTRGVLKICFDTLSPWLSCILTVKFLPHWKTILHQRSNLWHPLWLSLCI